MVFFKIVIQKNRKKQNQTEQNENSKKTDKNAAYVENMPTKKKKAKISKEQSVYKSIRS